jgi:hypothetical protein
MKVGRNQGKNLLNSKASFDLLPPAVSGGITQENRLISSMKYRCPICHKTVKASRREQSKEAKFFPFCSERCKLIDLGAWLDAKYQIVSNLRSQESAEPFDTSSDASTDKSE